MDNGISISNAQAIGIVLFFVSTIGGLLKMIQSLYADQNRRLEGRIAELKTDLDKADATTARTIEALEKAVDLMNVQTDVTAERVTPVRRSRGGG